MLPQNGDQNRLHFYMQQKNGGLLVKAYVPASGEFMDPPPVLRSMHSVLVDNRSLLDLREQFPEDAGTLLVIREVAQMGKVMPETISDVRWHGEYGHMLEFQLKIQPN